MASSSSKWSRKRSIDDESRSSPTLERESSKKEWKVKTLDEILQEKRRRLDHESPEGESESFRQSAKSSVTSSPSLQIDSRASSKNETPTQEIIYQLSPDHSSPLSTGSETSKKKAKTIALKQKGRRKTDEEEGEILSDISDPETGGTKHRSRASSQHVSADVEMVERPPVEEESTNQQEEESEEESSEEDNDSSSEEEPEEPTKSEPKTEKAKSSEEEEESSDSSEESEDSSEEEEDDEEEEEKNNSTAKDKSEEKVEDKKEESSEEDESEEDSDEESDDSEDSSEEDEKEEKKTGKEVEQKNTKTAEKVNVEEDVSSTKNTKKDSQEKPTKSSREHHYRELSSRHRKQEHLREDETDSGKGHEEKGDSSRSKKDRKSTKEDTERFSRKHKSSSESSDYKKTKDSKSRDKDRDEVTRSRERSERQSKDDSRAKRKEVKSSNSKEETKSSSKNRHSESSSKSEEKSKESKVKTRENKEGKVSKVLTEEERLQFASEVVDSDSDDHESVVDSADDNTDNEESNVSQFKETEQKDEPEQPKLPDYLPAIQGCRIVDEFTWLNRIEEGTYGVVYRARDKRTNEIVALKRLKMEKEKEGFPITSLREINTLLKGQHPNIVTVREVVVGKDMDKIFIVMDYVEHDLKTLMEHMNNKFAIGEVKTLLVQLLRAVAHLHDNWILHRDLKTSNLLLSNKGILKVADFGLAREYGSPLKPYTPIVVTLWYRAPELLLGVKEYACPIDMWSVGCIFAELLTMKPLFPGKSEIDQINRIFKDLGTPSDKIWPGPPSYSELPHVKKMTFTEYPYNQLRNKFGTHLTDKGFELLNRFLTYDPNKRITADEALKHEYFNESPYPVKPDMFPTWPAKSEMQKRPKKKDYEHSPKAPEGGEMFSKLKDGGDSSSAAEGLGFHMPSSKKGSAAVAGFSLKFNLK